MKLILFSHGDESVGIWPATFELDCPFMKDSDSSELEWFKERQIAIYEEATDMKIKAVYDFELNSL
jgi:hypothetical protein